VLRPWWRLPAVPRPTRCALPPPAAQITAKRDLRRAIRAIKRIGLEVEALRALSPHKNINGLVDALHTPDNVHLVLERADSDLYDWYEGPVSEVEARHVTGQVRSRRIRRAFCESFGSAGLNLRASGSSSASVGAGRIRSACLLGPGPPAVCRAARLTLSRHRRACACVLLPRPRAARVRARALPRARDRAPRPQGGIYE
jgi:hypothetical protein